MTGTSLLRDCDRVNVRGILLQKIIAAKFQATSCYAEYKRQFLHQYVRGADFATCLASGNLAGTLSSTRAGGTEAFKERLHRETFPRLRTLAAQPQSLRDLL
jgi:hypothetical protein